MTVKLEFQENQETSVIPPVVKQKSRSPVPLIRIGDTVTALLKDCLVNWLKKGIHHIILKALSLHTIQLKGRF